MPRSVPESREQQLEYIHRVLALTGWSQSVLARRAGLDPSTLSRFLSNERDGHALRPNSLLRIGEVTGIKAGSDSASDDTPGGLSESEASPRPTSTADDLTDAAIQAIVARGMNVDAWTLQSRALELAGYRHGDVLLVSLDEKPQPGDVVCAQIYDWTKSRAETVFRIYQPPFLVPASMDTQLLKPLSLEDGTIAIKGVVIQSFRARAKNSNQ